MASKERLWLSGFTTVSQVLAYDRLGIEELRQALDGDFESDQVRLAPWKAGFNAGIRASFGS
jgi:hypothetical protein